MKPIAASLCLFGALGLAGCATYPGDAPIVGAGPPAPAGTAVAIGQPVIAGPVAVTAMQVAEDSRCPVDAQCVWQGRFVVSARIDGAGWRETVNLTAGQDRQVRGVNVVLYEVMPRPDANTAIEAGDYRLKFDAMVPSS